MECLNCHESDWENVDFARMKPHGMSMCKSCGFISYPDQWKTPEEIKEHYRKSYRQPPTHRNIFTGERKNHFHMAFLHEQFEKWKAAGIDSPKILEIGSAFGFTLHWIRQHFPKAEITGTELTRSYRRNAWHEFKIKLDEDFDDTKKYDMILSYKVLEHQLSADKELERYQKALAPDGVMYLSVPTWLDSMTNFGVAGFDLEFYYDPNHINVWTIKHVEGLLKNKGLEIIKTDHIIYGSTYLLKANDSLIGTPVYKADPKETKQKLANIKAAWLAFCDNKFKEATDYWIDYPQAYQSLAEMSRKQLVDLGWEAFKEQYLESAIKACPHSPEMVIMSTDFAMRAGKWDEAIKYCERALKMKPENPVSLHQMTMIMRELANEAGKNKDQKAEMHYFYQAREVARHLRNVSMEHFKESTDLIYLFNSKLPFPGEDASPAKFMPRIIKPKEESGHASAELSI